MSSDKVYYFISEKGSRKDETLSFDDIKLAVYMPLLSKYENTKKKTKKLPGKIISISFAVFEKCNYNNKYYHR